MKTEIKADLNCQIIAIATTGIVAAGSVLFAMEAMKMNLIQNSPVPGVFEAVALVGTVVLAGEVIGYFTSDEELV